MDEIIIINSINCKKYKAEDAIYKKRKRGKCNNNDIYIDQPET